MGKFLERYNLLRLNQEEMENMNRRITSTKTETMIENLPTNKQKNVQGEKVSQAVSIKHLGRSQHLTFWKFTEEWTLPSSYCQVTLVVSNSVQPHRRQPTRLPCPWDSPGKNSGVGCHFLLQCMKVKNESEVAQSCPTLCDPMDCSLPGSSVHGIFQARVLEWCQAHTTVHLIQKPDRHITEEKTIVQYHW